MVSQGGADAADALGRVVAVAEDGRKKEMIVISGAQKEVRVTIREFFLL
jgi:hypothetical protein